MKWIKKGKLIKCEKTHRELQDWLNRGLELIVDKNVDIDLLKFTYNFNDYNRHRSCIPDYRGALTKEQFEFLKEITTIW